MKKKRLTPRQLIAKLKFEEMLKRHSINYNGEAEYIDPTISLDGETVCLKQRNYDDMIKRKEMSGKFLEWYQNNKNYGFKAKAIEGDAGKYALVGVELWTFSYYDLEILKETIDETELI